MSSHTGAEPHPQEIARDGATQISAACDCTHSEKSAVSAPFKEG